MFGDIYSFNFFLSYWKFTGSSGPDFKGALQAMTSEFLVPYKGVWATWQVLCQNGYGNLNVLSLEGANNWDNSLDVLRSF